MDNLPTGTVTFLFTDIEGSTRLWGQYPEAMKAALARHDALLRTAIEAQGGYVFKTVGDAFCAAFDTAPDALAAALAVQRSLHAEAWGQTGELRVRMALHTGAAEEREGDYFGPPLNRVARLLSTGYGGQILLSLATEELVRDHLPEDTRLQDLGAHRLKDLVRPEQVFQLMASDLPSSFPPLKSLETFPNNLPLQLTSFIGREREMGEVQKLLGSARLVTLTGSGGTGKTRLSLQVAAELLDSFADGIWLVELASLSDPQLVPQAVATALGVREEPGQPLLATLTAYLRDKQVLLVLDNCEHLVEACAQLAEALLRACPRLRILASGREGLGIGGETVFRVPSLSLPDARHLPPIETLTQYEAVQLFIDRAVVVVPAFTVTNQNAPTLAQVCHRLDGIPLAIELAAARVKVLSMEQIAARLDDRFRLLIGGSRTAQRRQQTLRAAIDWSYDLLSEPERILLRRLSVFAGGFTLEAAEAVCAGEGMEADEVLDLLAQLIDKSLVLVGEGEEPRYGMLETIRQYAQEKLTESGEAEAVRGRHLEFFLGLAERAESDLRIRLERLETEHDNLRAALAWGTSGQISAEMGLGLGVALGRFWSIRGYLHEGRTYLEMVLSQEIAAGCTTAWARVRAMKWAGGFALRQGDGVAARALYEASLAIYRELGDKGGIAGLLTSLGELARAQGDYAAARALHEESLAIFRELGDKPGVAWSLTGLGHVASQQGNPAAARGLYEESLTIYRKLGDKRGIAWSLSGLGQVFWHQEDSAQALALYQEAFALFTEIGDREGIALSLEYLAEVAETQKQLARAARLFGAAAVLREAIGVPIWPAIRTEYERNVADMRAQLDEGTFTAAWAEGRAMTMEQAVEYASRGEGDEK